MDLSLIPTSSAGRTSVTAELYFLIARLLGDGPCRNASEALKRELEAHGLLPKRVDWLGNEHPQSFDEVCRIYSHVGSNHLLELCRRLGPLVDKEVPSNVRGLHSLLGAGRQSILRRKEDLTRKPNRLQYVARQNQKPRVYPLDLVHTPNPVALVHSRELTGSIDHRNVVPPKLYGRVQQFCRTLGHLSAVYCVLFDRTGQYIFTGADDLLVKIWSAITGRLLATLRGASAEIADLAVSYDNTLLAAGSCDKIVRVWCLRTTAPVAVLTGHGGTITSINFCPADGGDRGFVRYLASTSSDGSVSFWEYIVDPSGAPRFFPKPHKFNEKIRPGQAQMLCASFSPGGMFLATGCADHHVRVYVMFAPEGPERILEKEAHSDRVDSIQWANSGLRFISGSKDGTALIWRYENSEWCTIKLRMTSRLDGASAATAEDLSQKLKVTMVTWSRDDRWVMTAVSDFSIKLWDSTTGALYKELRGHEGEAFVLEPHPHDCNVLLSAGHDGRLLIWDIDKGEVLKSFHNFIEGQGHGAVFDAKWNPSGTTIAATDSHGHLSVFGLGPSERFKKLPKAIFFHTDYRPLIRDAHHHVLDEQTQLAPHLMPPPFLVDSDGNPYPPAFQKLVPGREHLKDDQLVPTVVYNGNGDLEILAGVEAPQVAQAAQAPENGANAEAAAMPPPPPAPVQQNRTRSNIDQMIAELAQQQDRHRHRPRSSTSSTAAAAGPPPTPNAQAANADHSYTSRQAPRPVLAVSGTSPRALVSPVQGADEANPSVALSTEATTSESLPGFSRRPVIVKALSPGQLESSRTSRRCWAEEEVALFHQEVQRKSPNIFLNTSVSPNVAALLAARSRGLQDEGWSPSRPRRNHQPSRPVRRERPPANVSSPSRSRIPPISPARRPHPPPSSQQPSQQHNYRTRATRVNNMRERPPREGASEGTRERVRRVVRAVSSSDEGEDVDVEEENTTERRRRRRPSPREEEAAQESDDEEVRRTRSSRQPSRQQPQRNGDALSTSDSDDSESDSELASDLLDSDDSDSEAQASSSASSSEYSDWTAEAGVNLEPPKRTRKKVYRRPRCLSSEEEASPTATTSAGHANHDGGEDGENSNSPPAKKRRPPIPRPGTGGLDQIPEPFRPSEWLSEVVPRRSPFFPQMGDEVVYFRQGHELYVEAVKQRKAYEVNPNSLPWSKQTIREQELVKIIGIKYEIKPPRLCCLKLGLMDPATGALTGESFTIKYHDIVDVLDFLVLRQTYDLAMQRNWQPGDHFRCNIDDLWWEGQVEIREPFNAAHPNSEFLCYRIRWDNGESDQMSPWDLEPIDPERRPSTIGTGVTVLPAELAGAQYRPRAEDWPPGGDRDAECDRIVAGLNQAMSLAIAEPFLAPVDLNMYPDYAYVIEYPVDLTLIKARLENRFYRRVTAVQYDVRYIYSNACKYNQPNSDIVRSANILTDLCLEIIRNQEALDATALYHQLVEKYKATAEKDDGQAGGPSTSRAGTSRQRNGVAPNTPNTRSRSQRNSPAADSDESDHEGGKKSKGKNLAAKRISTRLAVVATLSWKQQCKDLLELLCASEDAEPFLQPVSILDVPDYLHVVDHPMDFQTVREQLQVNNYQTPMDFAKDVSLIFENSKNYNTNKKSRIYAMTIRLSANYEEHMKGILAAYKNSKSAAAKSKKSPKHSKNPKSKKGKSLVRPSKTKDSKGSKLANGNDASKESLKVVISRTSRGQGAAVPGTSAGTQPTPETARRRILEAEDEAVNGHASTSLPNGTISAGPSSMEIEVKPGPSGLSSCPPSTSQPITNGSAGRRVAQKRRIISEEEDDNDGEEEDEDVDEEEDEDDMPDLTGGTSEQTKGKSLKNKAIVPKSEPTIPEQSSDEDDTPISQRRRVAAAATTVKTLEPVKEEVARPASSSSNSSFASNPSGRHSHSGGSFCSDTLDPNGNPLRRSGRTRRKPKRPLDSESGDNDNFDEDHHDSARSRRPVRQTRNSGKRSTVRYGEDSDQEERRSTRNSRGQSHRQPASGTSEEDDDDEEYENEDPRAAKYQRNGRSGGLKRKRQSAQEATKKIRSDFAASSDEEEDVAVPTYSVSSRGRVRKLAHHSTQGYYD